MKKDIYSDPKEAVLKYPATEDYVQNKYSHAKLHDITRSKICLTVGQLEELFKLSTESVNGNKKVNYFYNLAEKKLDEKKKESLNFYDVTKLMDKMKIATKDDLKTYKKPDDFVGNDNDDSKLELEDPSETESIHETIRLLGRKVSTFDKKKADITEFNKLKETIDKIEERVEDLESIVIKKLFPDKEG